MLYQYWSDLSNFIEKSPKRNNNMKFVFTTTNFCTLDLHMNEFCPLWICIVSHDSWLHSPSRVAKYGRSEGTITAKKRLSKSMRTGVFPPERASSHYRYCYY